MTTNTAASSAASPTALSERQQRQIARSLLEVGDCPCPRRSAAGRAAGRGEVLLIKQNGKLRFIKKVTSEAALSVALDPRGAC